MLGRNLRCFLLAIRRAKKKDAGQTRQSLGGETGGTRFFFFKKKEKATTVTPFFPTWVNFLGGESTRMKLLSLSLSLSPPLITSAKRCVFQHLRRRKKKVFLKKNCFRLIGRVEENLTRPPPSPPNQQRALNKLPTELRRRIFFFANKHPTEFTSRHPACKDVCAKCTCSN